MERKSSRWDNLTITKKISVSYDNTKMESIKTENHANDSVIEELKRLTRNGTTLNEEIFQKSFKDILFKTLNTDKGFGFLSNESDHQTARVIMKGNSPFINNDQEILSQSLGAQVPYSLVYYIDQESSSNSTFYIFRHYLHLPSLTDEERKSIKIAVARGKFARQQNGRMLTKTFERKPTTEEKFSMKQERVSVKEERMVKVEETFVKSEKKTSIESQRRISQEQVSSQGKRLHKSSTKLALMDQMSHLLMPVSGLNRQASILAPGQLIVTVHKAANLEKKGLVGKADPYIVSSIGNQRFKSPTVSNDQHPVWHFTSIFDINELHLPDISLLLEVFDEDIGKDEFLGKCSLTATDIWDTDMGIMNKWIDLEGCKSGKILVSAKVIALEERQEEVGQLTVVVHKARKVEKKSKLRTSDPYVILKLGTMEHRSKTVNKNKNPEWEFSNNLQICKESPQQFSLQIFDDDIGKDAPLGNLVVDIEKIRREGNLESQWIPLENCKSGEILLSVTFKESTKKVHNNFNESTVVDSFEEKQVEHIKTETSAEDTKTFITQNFVGSEMSPELDHGRYGNDDNKNSQIDFLDPLYVDNEYLVVAGFSYNWFMVVSDQPELAIRSRLVPFKVLPDPRGDFKLFLYFLPGEGTHLIRKVQSGSKGLLKCGYEKFCVIRNGSIYQVGSFGRVIGRTWGLEEWVEAEPEKVEGRDYIETPVTGVDNHQEAVLDGPVSLYDRLSVDLKVGAFKMGS